MSQPQLKCCYPQTTPFSDLPVHIAFTVHACKHYPVNHIRCCSWILCIAFFDWQHSWLVPTVPHHIQAWWTKKLLNSSPLVGQPQSVPITLRLAAIFPLDVYFLMDFSDSMGDDLATLQSIVGNICMLVCVWVYSANMFSWCLLV